MLQDNADNPQHSVDNAKTSLNTTGAGHPLRWPQQTAGLRQVSAADPIRPYSSIQHGRSWPTDLLPR